MASTYITRTPSTGGNRTKWTWSSWIKIDGSGDGTYQYLLNCYYGNLYRYSYFCYRNGRIEIYGGDYQTSSSAMSFDVSTKRLLRDGNAWYHIVVAFDSTQSTSTDRIKLWINGVRETEFISYDGSSSATFPAQNDETFNNTTITPMHIGQNFNGIMSHIHYTDGYSYQASDFGETDTNGEWKIKTSPSISNYGVNGFWILKDGNSLTDQSSNSNNYSLGSGTLTNTEDNPSNNFAVINFAIPTVSQNCTVSNGGTTINSTSGAHRNAPASIALPLGNGKFYWEMKVDSMTTHVKTGVGFTEWPKYTYLNQGEEFSGSNEGYAYRNDGSKENNGISSYGNSYTVGDIIGIAFDTENRKLFFAKNGTWQNSGDPAAGTNPAFTVAADFIYYPVVNLYAAKVSFNFGGGNFGSSAIASEGTNASGIGKFEYDVPTGFTAISTKGLNL